MAQFELHHRCRIDAGAVHTDREDRRPRVNEALSGIWRALQGKGAALSTYGEAGPVVALPSAFRVTDLAAGAVGAATLAAAELLRTRDGVSRRVTVDRRHAAIAFRSERHLTIDGASPPTPWDPASGYYETADGGLVQTHCNFPHHRAGVLDELELVDPGDGEVAGLMAKAIGERDAQELEDALGARGMVAAMLRTPEEWAAHPHAQAVADLPVIEILPLGDALAEPLPDADGAVAGIRVADLTRVLAGPTCGRTLAAYGADVLRIGAEHLPVIGPVLADTNLGKRWANLDLRSLDDAATFGGLVADADVVMQGYRPGGLDSLGFSPEQLVAMRPGLVVASLSAYGHVGPWAGKRGFDSLVQTATGIGAAEAAAAGVSGTRPLPAQAHDHGAGWLLAAGVMEALRRRATVGGSWLVRTSLVQVRTFLGALGPVGDLGIADPGDDVEDLLATVDGRGGRVSHVRLPGLIAGAESTWTQSGSRSPSDHPRWLP
jgi:crotonobetainyl-CoA:carnitine CoA-transferase CaiB-like acyl-CoA transferase